MPNNQAFSVQTYFLLALVLIILSLLLSLLSLHPTEETRVFAYSNQTTAFTWQDESLFSMSQTFFEKNAKNTYTTKIIKQTTYFFEAIK